MSEQTEQQVETPAKEEAPQDFSQLIEQIQSVDPVQFSKSLQEKAHDHFNAIWRNGYGVSKGEHEKKLEAQKGEFEKLTKELQAREAKIKELSEKAPDMASITAKHEEVLQAKAREIELVQQEKDNALKEYEVRMQQMREDRFNADLERTLIGMGIDPDYADVLVQRSQTRKRIRWIEGTPKVYQEDGETPFPVTDGQVAYDILAKDLAKKVPAKFMNDRMPGASAYSGRFDANGRRQYSAKEIGAMDDTQLEKLLASQGWGGKLGVRQSK